MLSTTELSREEARELGERVASARRRARLTQAELASHAGLSKVWLSKIERGLAIRPGEIVLNHLAAVLGSDVIPSRRGPSTSGDIERKPFNAVTVDEETRREARLVPVYRWGSAGDPRQAESSPDPDHEEYPPLGRESLVGQTGFGVLIRGESMSQRGIHDGDTVWINPERPYRVGRPVLARLWDVSGECGMVVKTLMRREGDGDLCLCSEGDNCSGQVICDHYEIIGPVVGISPAFRLPT